jgi:hypothetical protein
LPVFLSTILAATAVSPREYIRSGFNQTRILYGCAPQDSDISHSSDSLEAVFYLRISVVA